MFNWHKNLTILNLFFFLSVFYCLILMGWISLFGKYCPHCVDHAWTTLLDYFYIKFGELDDIRFGGEIGTHKYISNLQAHLRGYFASLIGGWGVLEMRFLSIIWVILAAIVWYYILINYLGTNYKLAAITSVFMIISDAFFKASQFARQESLLLFIVSLIALFSLKRWYLFSGILVGIAFETHFSGGALGFVYALTAFIYYKDYNYRTQWLYAIVGGLLGILYYALLHYPYLQEIPTILQSGSSEGFSNIIYIYYSDARYLRHLPELILLIGCFYLGYRKKLFDINSIKYSGTGILMTIAISLLITRGSESYFAVSYPLITIFITSIIFQFKKSIFWFTLIVWFYTFMYATLAFYINKDYDEHDYLNKISQRINKNETIYLGHQKNFFAFNDSENNAKRFYGLNTKMDLHNKTFIWIRDSRLEKINAHASQQLINLAKKCPMTLIEEYQYNTRLMRFEKYHCEQTIKN